VQADGVLAGMLGKGVLGKGEQRGEGR